MNIFKTKQIENLEYELNLVKCDRESLEDELQKFRNIIAEKQKKIENLEERNQELQNLNEIKIKTLVLEETKSLKDKNTELTIKLKESQKEVEVMTKAFENMGYDVKNMNEILVKLVDGISQKSQVNVIK